MNDLIDKLKFNDQGLIPAVLQDYNTKEVLMVAYMNETALKKTLETNKATFWSRSRQELWLKGQTSGNYQIVKELRLDCDNDTLLVLVEPQGPACHTGSKSCFYRSLEDGKIQEADKAEQKADRSEQSDYISNQSDSLQSKYSGMDVDISEEEYSKTLFLYRLYGVIAGRKANPVEGSYTNYLFDEGVDKICKKVGEEAAEVIIGAKNADKEEMVYEIGDLIYHLMVLMNLYEIPITDILDELESRSK